MPSNIQPAESPLVPQTSSAGSFSRWAHILRSPRYMVLVAFTVRVLWIALAHTYRLRTSENNLGFGWETGRIAYSLATGHGFSSPFGGDTGPSAWTAPVYPWVVAFAFRTFGVYSRAAAFWMLVFNSFFAALTSWTIYRTAQRVFGERVAVWSGWIWALLPNLVFWSVKFIWETSLSAFLLSLLFLLTLELEGEDRLSSWFAYGLLWGVMALTNPAALAFLPFAGTWLAYQLYRRGKRFLLPAATGAVIFWITIMPWLVRNDRVMGKPVFIRDNFGVEFRVGNNPLAEGINVGAIHPIENQLQFENYKRLGEAAFAAEQGRLAREWVSQHPARFLTLSFRRFIFFWAGIPKPFTVEGLQEAKNLLFLASSLLAIGGLWLAWRHRVHGIFLFATLLVSYPMAYYITFPQPRYRHPIEPQLLILAVYLVTEAKPRTNSDGIKRPEDNS